MRYLHKVKKRPNVVLIMTDQHRADLMTCAGNDIVPTPNIDGIARRGVRFTNAYCPYPVCLASRSAMLTGLYAHTTGAINNCDRLDWRYRTMAHRFAEHGYLTSLIGKMHFNDAHKHGFEYYLSINDWLMYLGPKVRLYANEIANHPLAEGFFDWMMDDGAGFPDVADLWPGPGPWAGHVKRHDFSNMASELESEDHLDAFIARETCKFLRRHRGQPLFLVASFMKPHTPLFPPREWAEMYPVDAMTLPEVGDIEQYPPHVQENIRSHLGIDRRLRQAHRAGYLGNLAFVDSCVGQVCDELDRLGLWEDTIVVYTSDHGEMDGDHGLFQKFCLFEPAVRVPLIVCHHDSIPEDRVTEALTEQIGLYPTLAELAGTGPPREPALVSFPGPPKGLEARSFADVARDPASEGPGTVFGEYNLRGRVCQYMLRTRRHKYVMNQDSLDELYDLERDPGEHTNLVHDPDARGTVDEMRRELLNRYDPSTNPFRPKS